MEHLAIDFKPHNYQKYAIDKVIDNEKFGLFLDMGLGKTVSTLTAFSQLQLLDTDKMLVIAPKQVAKDTWVDEVDKWNHLNHLKVSLVLGTPKERNAALNTEADIYVTNKENTKWLCNQYKKEWPFDMVVIDELSTFKSPKSQRFKSIKKKLPLINRFIGLTGTPSPNSLQDLWAQVYLIDRGERLESSFSRYRERYFKPTHQVSEHIFNWELRDGSEEKIYERIEDICLSMKAKDFLNMPERIDTKQTVALSDKERKVYEELEKNYILESEEEGTVVAQNGASLSQKLLQPASAGHGLNLQQGGHIIVWFGLTWSLELYQQANARLYRQGQNHTTIIHHIITDNTIDQRVYKALQNKELTQEELMKAIKARIAKHK
ncbi:TPA: DEAD/DEAH box helicase [Staphylococcus aureus]|nr:DEAD/DEAH box helicase [Staphylococcus aureus]